MLVEVCMRKCASVCERVLVYVSMCASVCECVC